MKFLGNIVCTIAIFAQFLLSAGLLTHAPDCAASQPITASDHHISNETLSHDCGCYHHGHETSVHDEHCYSLPPAPDHDCTCTPQKTYPYVLDDLIIEQKSKNQLLDDGIISSAHIDFTQLSLLLCKSNPSNGPPPLIAYLPQHNARYTSIYLGVFLL